MGSLRNVIYNFRLFGLRRNNEQGRRNRQALKAWAVGVPWALLAWHSMADSSATQQLFAWAALLLAHRGSLEFNSLIDELEPVAPAERVTSAWAIKQRWKNYPGIRVERVL